MKEKSNSKRFKVFQRDKFTCQYCGSIPPEVILEVDHIVPKSKGGKNDIDNLTTACFECNRGKGATDLKSKVKGVERNFDDLKERYKQLSVFYKYQEKMEFLTAQKLFDLSEYWGELWGSKYTLNARGESSVKMFLKHFTVEEIKEAMYLGCSKVNAVENAYKYMCGVLQTKLRQRKESYGRDISDN